jgi:invasion protein IalB
MKSLPPIMPQIKSITHSETKAKQMKFVRTSLFLSLSLLLISLSQGFTNKAQAESFKVRKTHGHWHLSCGTPPGAKSEKCALVQDVTDETRPNYSLRVIFLRSRDGKKEVLRVVAPLGVLLPTGLGLKIDNTDMGHAQFMKCGKIGCIAEVVVTNKIVEKFRTGKNAVFIIFQTPELGIGFPVSLNGFGAGYRTLK